MAPGAGHYSYIGGGGAGTARESYQHTGDRGAALNGDGFQGLSVEVCIRGGRNVEVHGTGLHPDERERPIRRRGCSDALAFDGYLGSFDSSRLYVYNLADEPSR